MAKAETGTGGAVVSELAYRNDYVALRGTRSLPKTPGARTGAGKRRRCAPSLRLSQRPDIKPAPNSKGPAR